jgi:hypothetical protein
MPTASKKTRPLPAQPDLYLANVIAFDRDDRPIVRLLGAGSDATLRCDVLDSGLGPLEVTLGDSVLAAVYPHDPSSGCILGRIVENAAASSGKPIRRKQLHLELDTLHITAQTEVVLETPQARIRLDEEGRIELLAHTLVSKARRLLKLLAPMLRLN